MKSSQVAQNRVKRHVLELAALQVQVLSSFAHFPLFTFLFFIFSLSPYIFPSF
jgi:hypothetical protein